MLENLKFNYFKWLAFSLLALFFTVSPLQAAEDSEGGGSGTDFIFHHIQDGYQWHFFSVGDFHATIYLPVILYSEDRGLEVFSSSNFYEHHEPVAYKGYELDHGEIIPVKEGRGIYDFSITKNVFATFISVLVMFLIFFAVAARYKKYPESPPKGIQSFFEPIILFIRDNVAIPSIGEQKYQKFMPFLLTLFFFILINNLLGLLPVWANVTGNISVTFTLAVFTFLITQFSANKDYWKHVFNMPGIPKWLLVIMVPIEFIGLFTKPFALMVRLFANITAGHIILLSIIGLTFIFESIVVGPFSVIFASAMYFLELLVAFIQAYIFTLLSALYFGGAVEEHHHEGEEAHA